MNEIYEFLNLAKLFIYTQFAITGIFLIAGILFAIKKRLFKYTFRKHDEWNNTERIEKLESECFAIEHMNNDIENMQSDLIKMNESIKHLHLGNDNVDSLIQNNTKKLDNLFNELYSSIGDHGQRLFALEMKKLPTSKQYAKSKKK